MPRQLSNGNNYVVTLSDNSHDGVYKAPLRIQAGGTITIDDQLYERLVLPLPTGVSAMAIPAVNVPQQALVSLTSALGAGGGTSAALSVPGLLASDTIVAVTQITGGANGKSITGYNTQIAGGLTVTFTADPGAGASVSVLVLR